MPDPNGFIPSSCNLGCLAAPGRLIIMISQVHLTCRMNASVLHRIFLRFVRPMYRSKTVLDQQFDTFQRQVGQLQSQFSAQTLVAPSYSTYNLHMQTPEGVLRTSCEWHSRRSSRSAQYIAHYRPNMHGFPGFSFPILYSLFAYLIPAYSSTFQTFDRLADRARCIRAAQYQYCNFQSTRRAIIPCYHTLGTTLIF